MTTAITPEILDQPTAVLESTPITAAEVRTRKNRIVKMKAALLDKMERDLFLGQQFLEIIRTKEYRGLEAGDSGLTFAQWLEVESPEFTLDGQPIGQKTAEYLRGFYYFREEVLSGSGSSRSGNHDLPMPTSAYQVRPLLFLLDHLRRDASQIDPRCSVSYDDRRAAEAKAIDIWKAAVTEAKGKTPTFDQVNRARLADEAAEQHRLRGRANSTPPHRPAVSAASVPSAGHSEPAQQPRMFMNNEATWPSDIKRDYLPQAAPEPSIPAWELEQTDDSTLDAGEECKRISRALSEAHKAIGTLRGILYSQINKHGSDYLTFLRQVDAGVYSLHNINEQVGQMSEDVAFIAELLTADVGEGELAASTISVEAFPTRA